MSKIDKVIDYLYETNGDFVDKAEIIGLKSNMTEIDVINMLLTVAYEFSEKNKILVAELMSEVLSND